MESRWNLMNLFWLIWAFLVVMLDQLTKFYAVLHLSYGQSQPVWPFFNLTLAHNPGAAFSFLSKAGGWQFWFLMLVAAAVIVCLLIWLLRLPRGKVWVPLALMFVLAGAVGNLWDRVTLGYVIDFLDFHVGQYHWPIFNVADSAVTIGAFMLIIDVLKKDKKEA